MELFFIFSINSRCSIKLTFAALCCSLWLLSAKVTVQACLVILSDGMTDPNDPVEVKGK